MDSMTGFGRAGEKGDGFMVTVEAKSLNHRNLSLSLKLPDCLSVLEMETRKAVDKRFSRGRIRLDASVELCDAPGSAACVSDEAAEAYLEAALRLSKKHGIPCDITASELMSLPGVLEKHDSASLNGEFLNEAYRKALDAALEQLAASRSAEGRALEDIFREGFCKIRDITVPFLQQQEEAVEKRFRRMKDRVEELLKDTELEEDRMMQEMAVIADRSDVSEEVQRLQCHIESVLSAMDSSSGPMGRRLEFLIQEMHRELNTMGAKVDDSRQSMRAIEMKTILSSLKEQAANIE